MGEEDNNGKEEKPQISKLAVFSAWLPVCIIFLWVCSFSGFIPDAYIPDELGVVIVFPLLIASLPLAFVAPIISAIAIFRITDREDRLTGLRVAIFGLIGSIFAMLGAIAIVTSAN